MRSKCNVNLGDHYSYFVFKCVSIEQPRIGLGQITMSVMNNDCLQ